MRWTRSVFHSIPESTFRKRMFGVVKLQGRLLRALCRSSAGTTIDLEWMKSVWPIEPDEWISKFLNNDKGRRAAWCQTIAGSTESDKQRILILWREQLHFRRLYKNQSRHRFTLHGWKVDPFAAANKLLKSFYAPLFYQDEGYSDGTTSLFHKEHYLGGMSRPKVCPYTDTTFQDTKLDHFLPQDSFPMLSCHPDNLIPCSTDSNSGSHKGKTIPLDLSAPVQAANWFHPRLRPASDTFNLGFSTTTAHPTVSFHAKASHDQPRLDNLTSMFGLIEFWSRDLDDEIALIAGEIADGIKFSGGTPDGLTVRLALQRQQQRLSQRIGHDDKAIVKASFIGHLISTPSLFAQILRTCTAGT